jgi:hypothetical protein
MTGDEVAQFTERANVEAVLAYRDAVGARTRQVVMALAPAAWVEPLGPADTADMPVDFVTFPGRPRALELGTAAINHNAMHLGEAVTIRSLAGCSLPG